MPQSAQEELSSVSTPQSSSPMHNAAESETPITRATSEDNDMTDKQHITAAMLAEEERMQQDTDKDLDKMRVDVQNDYNSTVNSQRVSRLKFLLERSTLYSSILAQKLEKQQQKAREKGNKEKKSSSPSKTKKSVQTVAEDGSLTRETRSGEKIKQEPLSKKKSGQKRVKQEDYSIADYVESKDLKHAGDTKAAILDATVKTEKPDKLLKASVSARQPALITGGVLKEYQLAGVEWLVSLFENGLNGILADEMGLGKTLQTIAFLAFLRGKGVWGPFLVVAPLSTLANWINEFERFAPSIPVVLYHGKPEEREEIRKTQMRRVDNTFPIVVTSYEISMNDEKHLGRHKWKYIIVDEGHRIKNLNCKLIRKLKEYHSANRLLLTGTPLQNNLSELWSLLNFLLPDIFDDLDSFQSWFDFTELRGKDGASRLMDTEQQTSVVSTLHQILKPFLLRRLKVDVEQNLPKKKEYLLYAPLTRQQVKMYDAVVKRDIKEYLVEQKVAERRGDPPKVDTKEHPTQNGKSSRNKRAHNVTQDDLFEDEKLIKSKRKRRRTNYDESLSEEQWLEQLENGHQSADDDDEEMDMEAMAAENDLKAATKQVNNMKLQNMVMQLRKVCNHPFLLYWPRDPKTGEEVVSEEVITASGKMLLLNRMLDALFARGHKVLVFSQFTTMLDIIEDWATEYKGWNVCRIDGAVAQDDRRHQIKEFNESDDVRLFLLSTRAGGLGINLTSADTVILFDSDWNPQMDLQAQDRVHRIGQTKPVIIYRFAARNTVESKIIEKASAKRKLEKLVISRGKFKLPAVKGADMSMSELADILMREDNEAYTVAEKDDRIISDEDMEKLMDRSPEAYESKNTTAAYREMESMGDQANDALA